MTVLDFCLSACSFQMPVHLCTTKKRGWPCKVLSSILTVAAVSQASRAGSLWIDLLPLGPRQTSQLRRMAPHHAWLEAWSCPCTLPTPVTDREWWRRHAVWGGHRLTQPWSRMTGRRKVCVCVCVCLFKCV